MFKTKSLLLATLFFSAVALFLLLPGSSVSAETCKENTKLDFVARDPGGSYIPGAKVEVYLQRVDANGHNKPTTRVASVTADPNLGIARLSWRNSLMSDVYAIKVYLINKPAASFWYYGLVLGCGESAQKEETLSGIDFTIRDASGELLTNTNFNIYSQLYDASGNSQKIKKDLLVTLNSGSLGQATAYLPQGSIRSIDNKTSDVYALEITRAGIKSTVYDIKVTDKELTNFDFFTSAIHVRLQNLAGASYPVNTKLEVYKQELDADGVHKQGTKVGTLTIGADGYGSLELPVGLYVLGLKGLNGKYQYFWDTEVIDGRSTDYTFTPEENWDPNVGACQNNSNFILSLRDTNGDLAFGLKFELYEQLSDFNGLPIAGKKAGGGTIDKSGSAKLTFKPDPRKIYALKVWDKQANVGEFWFYDGIRFVCDYDRILTKIVPSLTIVLRDGQGKLRPNYAFSLYAMRYDVDGKPTASAADLIGNFKTDSSGAAKIHVAYYNPYRANQSGFYIFNTKNSAGQTVAVNGLYAEKNYTFNYYFSGLKGELRNVNNKVLVGKEVRLYEQVNDSGVKSLGKLIAKVKTGSGGLFNFEISSGTYALATIDDLNRENIFWDVAVKAGKAQTLKLKTGLVNFKFGALQGEALAKDPSIRLYPLLATTGNNYERDPKVINLKLVNRVGAKSLAAGPYLISYLGRNGEYGQTFRVVNGKKQTIVLNINKASKITATQTFTVK